MEIESCDQPIGSALSAGKVLVLAAADRSSPAARAEAMPRAAPPAPPLGPATHSDAADDLRVRLGSHVAILGCRPLRNGCQLAHGMSTPAFGPQAPDCTSSAASRRWYAASTRRAVRAGAIDELRE